MMAWSGHIPAYRNLITSGNAVKAKFEPSLDYVTSMTAPVASGWSGCRVGLAPTGKRQLVAAHTRSGHRLALA
jgi:hypothetical protein